MLRRAAGLGLPVDDEEGDDAETDGHLWTVESGYMGSDAAAEFAPFDWQAAELPEPVPDRAS